MGSGPSSPSPPAGLSCSQATSRATSHHLTRPVVVSDIHLLPVEARIETFLRHQLPVTALFHNLTVFHHEDAIGIPDRREPVGDDEGGASPHQPAQCVQQ